MSNTLPDSLGATHSLIRSTLSHARELAQAMYDNACANPVGLNPEILERMRDMDVQVPTGQAADAQKVAEFLVCSPSPLQEIYESQTGPGPSAQSSRQMRICMMVVQAGLAEQQNADCTLRADRGRFDANALEQALDDWVLYGRHRRASEDAPLSQIATIIDMSQHSAETSCQTRLGCVIPVVVSIHVWKLWQQSGR